jgi:GT2 family glycosyltransferase
MKYPSVNILVLNWNGADILYDCIESIYNSNYSNYVVTIIDNGSSDDSVQSIKNSFKKINLIYIINNLGYAKGYNYAFNKLLFSDNSEYYFLLNNDTVIEHDTVSRLIEATHLFGSKHIFSPKIINDNSGKIWYAGGKISKVTGTPSHIGINKSNDITDIKSSFTDFVSGCAMLIPKISLHDLNGFSESYSFYYEDVDICLRAKNLGLKCVYVNDSIVNHKISYSMGGRFSLFKLFHATYSRIKYLFYCYNFIFFIIYLIINIVCLPVSIFRKILRIAIK